MALTYTTTPLVSFCCGMTDATAEEMPTFNATRNPNSSDLLERNIMLSKWKGFVPGEDWKPANAKDAARKV